jgi:hypothetical protein
MLARTVFFEYCFTLLLHGHPSSSNRTSEKENSIFKVPSLFKLICSTFAVILFGDSDFPNLYYLAIKFQFLL